MINDDDDDDDVGIEGGNVGSERSFTVETISAGRGDVNVTVTNPLATTEPVLTRCLVCSLFVSLSLSLSLSLLLCLCLSVCLSMRVCVHVM